eukprot:Skav227307  [mRNA]  locus=scaffold2645:341784:343735:- [translate_table: standard]
MRRHEPRHAAAQEVSQLQLASSNGRLPPEMLMPRCAAIKALGAMGAGNCAKAVAQARGLLDKVWHVRRTACEAMAQLGEARRVRG